MGYNNHKVCQSNCLRESCFSDTDCGGPGACCRGNKCTKTGCDECQKNSDCSGLFSKYCCRKRYLNEQNTCSITCIGESCQRDSDCGPRDECCGIYNHCTKINCVKIVHVATHSGKLKDIGNENFYWLFQSYLTTEL